MRTILTVLLKRCASIHRSATPARMPTTPVNTNFIASTTAKVAFSGCSFSTALALDKVMVVMTMTAMSTTIVTPSTVCVKGPRARISLMMAMAGAGAVLPNTAPMRIAIAMRADHGRSRRKGM